VPRVSPASSTLHRFQEMRIWTVGAFVVGDGSNTAARLNESKHPKL
jgi:hypothetical protein